jgi:phage terminase large subunit-like protein
VRGPADELAMSEGCWFDLRAAEFVRSFLEGFCKQSIGEWAEQPLTLLPWQWQDVVAPLYGWKRPDGRRRFRSAYIQVAKKNGKSTLVSGLSLYHLLADGEAVPEIDLCACDKTQAGIVYNEASRMRASSASLRDRIEDIPSELRLICPANRGKIEAMSKVSETKDGFNPSLVVFDELHRAKDDALWRVFRYAGRARRNFLRIVITTAGTSEDVERKSVCYQQYRYSCDVRDGKIPDSSHLVAIYEPPDAEDTTAVDLDDRAVWQAANPSLGHTITVETFKQDLAAARNSPRELAEFQQLCLNLWVSSRTRFLKEEDWRRCGRGVVDEAELAGRPCFAGLDLASTTDLAALALVFPFDEPDGGGQTLKVIWRCWCPRDGAERRSRADGVKYLEWAEQGWLTLTDGGVTDYDYIRREIAGDAAQGIKGLADRFRIQKLLVDRWNASQLVIDLRDKDGVDVEMLGQGFASLSAPTKELERQVLSGRLHHGGNPLAGWMAGNANVATDAAGNLKLDKAKSTERIDLLASLVNAVAGWMASGGELLGPSVYEERGVEFLG